MKLTRKFILFSALLSVTASSAIALDLDWSGQFRAESHWVQNYSLGVNNIISEPALAGKGGYYVPGGGETSASFQTLFMRLRPKVIVNDNIALKSEWWLGDPVYGLYGDGVPNVADQKQFYSNQSRGSTIRAQRFWGEFISDVGTVQVGRAPLHWGLGVVWNKGDGISDRYMSTGDVIRLHSKFGAFSVVPSFIKYSEGNNIGGACLVTSGACSPTVGDGALTEYSLIFKYENLDEDFEGGLNFIKRIAGGAQDAASGYFGAQGVTAGANFNTFSIYGSKKVGKFSLAAEIPLTSGDIGGLEFNTYAVALETRYRANDWLAFDLKAGQAPGQPNNTGSPESFKAFYFHPGYKPGLIMFNYQFANFAGPNNPGTSNAGYSGGLTDSTLRSPYDNPISNATYGALATTFTTEPWTFHGSFMYARALKTADATGNYFNAWERRFYSNTSGVAQSPSLGFEMDYGAKFKWDDYFEFGLDLGWWFPGDFFKFTNVAGREVELNTVFATVLRAGLSF